MFIELWFPLIMIALPMAWAGPSMLLTRRPPTSPDKHRGLAWSLLVATAAAAGIIIGVHAMGWHAAARWTWMLFFPLWFGIAMPLVRACGADRPQDGSTPAA